MALKFKITIDCNLPEKTQEIVKEKINEKLLKVYAEVVPITPVGKSIRGRTEKNRLVKEGKKRIRKGYTGGLLRKSWGIIPANEIKDGAIVGYLYNSVHYAGHVNFGHRTRQGMGKSPGYKPKKDGKKYVNGKHFLSIALRKAREK